MKLHWIQLPPAVWVAGLFLMLIPNSCEKMEGPGGNGSISGTLYVETYNDDYSLKINRKPAVDEEIFILYGDKEIVGDRDETSISGKFRFNYLYPGNYTLYYSTEDSTTLLDEDYEVTIRVELGNGEDVDLGELVQLKTLDYDDGDATIRGVVKLINYTNESEWPNLVIKDISYAQEQEVYLTYNNHTFYDDRIRTQYDGSFEFNHLIPGEYLIFLYSEDVTGATQDITVSRKVTITQSEQVVDLGEITIEKH